MSAAFLILAHDNPEHLSRLVSRLQVQNGHIYIHLDGKVGADAFGPFEPDRVTFVEPRTPVYWGDISMVNATLAALLQAATDSRFRHDYFVLLSGADYPVLPANEIDKLFSAESGAIYLDIVPLPSPGKEMSRIRLYWFRGSLPRLLLKLLDRLSRLLPARDCRGLLTGELYAGDQWWALPRDAVLHVLEFVDRNPHIMKFLEHSRCPDEFIFQYTLGNSEFKSRITGTLTYTRWKPHKNSPEVIDRSDLARLLARPQTAESRNPDRPKNLPFAFARKFPRGTDGILDAIDESLKVESNGNRL